MTVILGIDPGLRRTGWCVLSCERGVSRYVASGVLQSSSDAPMPQRLLAISRGLEALAQAHRPDVAAVEETFVNANPLSSLKLGQARGAILLSLARLGLSVEEYAANAVKKTVVGKGKAEKAQVASMVGMLLPAARADVRESHDRADAVAVALCCAHHMQWKKTAGLSA
ncbi:MAG: crossover junction endodeoxyribonuclease RuvC [Rickettsiales bacterium]